MTGGYVQRDYRRRFREDRRVHFTVKCRETDLCIGIDRASWQEEIPAFARRFVEALRAEMDAWIAGHPEYARALVPQEATEDAPGIFHEMAAAARRSGIGPMSAVAGALSAKEREQIRPIVINGIDKQTIREMRGYAKSCPGNMVEVMACEGGCVNGCNVIANPKIATRQVKELAKEQPETK